MEHVTLPGNPNLCSQVMVSHLCLRINHPISFMMGVKHFLNCAASLWVDDPWGNPYWLSSCQVCLFCFPPCRDYSFLKLLIHPPDSDCSLHPPSCSQGLWPPVVYIPVGETGNGGVQSVPGLKLGTACFESVRKASSYPIASRAESGEAMGPGELSLLCEEDPKPCSGQREGHA